MNVAIARAQINLGGPPVQPALRQHRNWGAVIPLEKRLEAYKRFQKLRGRGKSTHEVVRRISKQFGVSQSTVMHGPRVSRLSEHDPEG